jgi:hypothetical protein
MASNTGEGDINNIFAHVIPKTNALEFRSCRVMMMPMIIDSLYQFLGFKCL